MWDARNVWETVVTYMGETKYPILFLFVLLYCYVKASSLQRVRYTIIIVLGVLLVFNDYSRKIVGSFVGMATYYRFLWAIPFLLLLAFGGTELLWKVRGRLRKSAVLLLLAVIIVFAGSTTGLRLDSLRMPENKYNIPDDICEAAELIHSSKVTEQPVVVGDLGLMIYLRGYDASLVWGMDRSTYQTILAPSGIVFDPPERYKEDGLILRTVYGSRENMDVLRQLLEEKRVDYFICATDLEMDDYYALAGYELIGRTQTRSVYEKSYT